MGCGASSQPAHDAVVPTPEAPVRETGDKASAGKAGDLKNGKPAKNRTKHRQKASVNLLLHKESSPRPRGGLDANAADQSDASPAAARARVQTRSTFTGLLSMKAKDDTQPRLFQTKMLLLCNNCEDPTAEPKVRCLDCSADGSVVVFCDQCNQGLHKGGKFKLHRRMPFQQKDLVHLPHHDPEPSQTAIPSTNPENVVVKRPPAATAAAQSTPCSCPRVVHRHIKGLSRKDSADFFVDTSNPDNGLAASSQVSKPLKGEVFQLAYDDLYPITPLACPLHRNLFDGRVVHVSCGLVHAAAVTDSGALFTWGDNSDFQLGVGDDKTPRSVPVHVPVIVGKDLEKVVQVECAHRHSVCLTASGDVFTWGSGVMGKLGHGGDADKFRPSLVDFPDPPHADSVVTNNVIYVAAGQYNTAAVVQFRYKHNNFRARTQIYVWGAGDSGQVGNSKRAPQLTPAPTDMSYIGTHNVAQVSLGNRHTVAVTVCGKVFAWGSNEFGQLGIDMAAKQETRRSVSGAAQAVPLSGSLTTFDPEAAEKAVENLKGLQLVPLPVRFPRPKTHDNMVAIAFVACGENHTTALDSAGSLWSWGSGETHQIGVFDNVDQFSPVEVQVTANASVGSDQKHDDAHVIVDVSIGASVSACVSDAGKVFMWGYAMDTPVPKWIDALDGEFIQSVSIGANENVVALTGTTQEIHEWFFDSDDDRSADNYPVQSDHLRGKWLCSLSCGKEHQAVVTRAGKLMCWGKNDFKQLGTGNEINYPIPTTIVFADKVHIRDVRCGVTHTVALSRAGDVYTWGDGLMGKLGHGSDRDEERPRLVAALKNPFCVDIACGSFNSGCVDDKGVCYTWGSNTDHQLGHHKDAPTLEPSPVAKLQSKNITQLDFGSKHTVALSKDGDVFTWGNDDFGQLGNGGTGGDDEDSQGPCAVSMLKNEHIVLIACGSDMTLAVSQKGQVWGWGSGETKQLCSDDDQFFPRRIPFPGGNETKIKAVACGAKDCAAVDEKGHVYTWGWVLGSDPQLLLSAANTQFSAQMVAVGEHTLLFCT